MPCFNSSIWFLRGSFPKITLHFIILSLPIFSISSLTCNANSLVGTITNAFNLFSNFFILLHIGIANDALFPVPVFDLTNISFLSIKTGITLLCTCDGIL